MSANKPEGLQLSALGNAELQALIVAAAAELASRATALGDMLKFQRPSPEAMPAAVLVPAEHDLAFIQAVLGKAKKGELIRAAEKDKYAEIRKLHEAWFTFKRYPTSLRGRGAEDFQSYGRL